MNRLLVLKATTDYKALSNQSHSQKIFNRTNEIKLFSSTDSPLYYGNTGRLISTELGKWYSNTRYSLKDLSWGTCLYSRETLTERKPFKCCGPSYLTYFDILIVSDRTGETVDWHASCSGNVTRMCNKYLKMYICLKYSFSFQSPLLALVQI